MNTFKQKNDNTPEVHWNWQAELLSEAQETQPTPCEGSLRRLSEILTHFTDDTGQKIYLILHGTPPEKSPEELLRTANAMENALLNERSNRLPIY